MSLQIAGFFLTLLVSLPGCAFVQQNAGFGDVAGEVKQRSGMSIVWNSGTELDRQAEEQIQRLLKNKLSADAAVQVALLNNRNLQAMYSDIGVAQADVIQAGLLKNPIFDGRVKFPVTGGLPDLELGTAMGFLDILYIPLKKRVAEAQFEQTKLRITGAVLEFAAQVRRAFYSYQADAQMLELRGSIAQALGLSLDIARRLKDAGNISDLTLARERALAEAAKLQLRSAEVQETQSRERLNVLMGLWGREVTWQTDQRLPELPSGTTELHEIERASVERSVDLARARQRIIVAAEQLGLSRSTALFPDVGFGPHAERNAGAWEVGPAVELPIPIFDQGQGRVATANAELRRAQDRYYALAVRIRSTARAVRDRLRGSQDRALYYRDVVLPLNDQIVNQAQLQYNAMQLGVTDLIRAREQQIEAAAGYVDALRDYWLARTDLGELMSGRLPSPNDSEAAPRAAMTSR